MVLFPNCKINLGLRILRKRSDGYHDLESVFYPLPIHDALEVIENPKFDFYQTGLKIESWSEENICIKAYQLLKKDFPQLPSVQMHLHKAIPVGAGIGGGSSDGAFTLKLLNKKFGLGLSAEQLLDHAKQLGSDCPFFITNKPCYTTGRGEILETIQLDLSAYKIVVINPGIHVSTTWAFSQISPALPDRSIKEIIQQPVESWKDKLKNDFEESVFKKYPEVKQIKDDLHNAGAVYAAMSGSGSSVYGIFEKSAKLQLNFPSTYFTKKLFSQLQ